MNLTESVTLKSGKKIDLLKITGKSNKNILIIGVFHGEEPQGFWAIEDYFLKNNQKLL